MKVGHIVCVIQCAGRVEIVVQILPLNVQKCMYSRKIILFFTIGRYVRFCQVCQKWNCIFLEIWSFKSYYLKGNEDIWLELEYVHFSKSLVSTNTKCRNVLLDLSDLLESDRIADREKLKWYENVHYIEIKFSNLTYPSCIISKCINTSYLFRRRNAPIDTMLF